MKKPISKKNKEIKAVKKVTVRVTKKIVARSAKKIAPKKVLLVKNKKKKPAKRVLLIEKEVAPSKHIQKKVGFKFPVKKIAYILLATLGGLLIAITVNAFFEIILLKQFVEFGIAPMGYKYFGYTHFLPTFTEFLFLFFGLLAGMWLGILGWDLVYVQGKHCKKWFKNI
jgi:hypothetical protein